MKELLSLGNAKVGEAIHLWSLPAVTTCPGKTKVCTSVCYANRSRFLYPQVRRKLAWNLKQSLRPDFVSRMVSEIKAKGAMVVRIHAAGDFATAEYADKWCEIIRQCPGVRFYGYTRSYRVPDIAKVLERMAAFRNMRLWYSLDSETGVPTKIPKGVKLCYLQTDENTVSDAKLVFRVRKLRKRIALPTVCVAETAEGKGTTCGSCRRCFA